MYTKRVEIIRISLIIHTILKCTEIERTCITTAYRFLPIHTSIYASTSIYVQSEIKSKIIRIKYNYVIVWHLNCRIL